MKDERDCLTLKQMDEILEDCFEAIKIMAHNEMKFLSRIQRLEERVAQLEDSESDLGEDRILN